MLPLKLRISHSDLDGLGAILVDYYAGIQFNTKFMILNYPDIQDESGNFVLHETYPVIFNYKWKSITITDISLPIELFIEKLKYKDIPIYWFDHHLPSIGYLNDGSIPENVFMKHGVESCGAKLYYDWVFEGKRTTAVFKEFIDLVNTYDLWLQDSELWPMAEDLNRLLTTQTNYRNKSANGFQKVEKFIDWMTRKFQLQKGKHFEFTDYELKKIANVKSREYMYLKKAKEEIKGNIYEDSKGYKWVVFSSPAKISFVANKLLKEFDIDYAIGVNLFDMGNLGRISVRSNKGFDVNWLNHVSGHECAGGGILSEDKLHGVWKQGVELGYK